ncbi:MAG: hypothetical protein ACYC8T_09945 [Myxococcaceae bacterium]
MKRLLSISFAALAAVFTLGCPTGGGGNDGGSPDGDVDPEEIEITVSGTARVHPVAAAYLADAGLPAMTVEGLTLRVEEPLKVALSDPTGVFGSMTLTSAGTFSVAAVPVTGVVLGVAAGIRDDTDGGTPCGDGGVCPRLVRSATTLYDVALQGAKPSTDIVGGKAWAIPAAFHDKLTAAVTVASVKLITSDLQTTLIGAGFILGQVVTADGTPLAGATIEPTPSTLAPRFFYPTADLSSTGPSTSANGLFVFVHDGGDVNTFKFKVAGKTEYLTRNGGSARDACLVITVYPGKVAP